MRPRGMVLPSISTGRVVVRARPCTGVVESQELLDGTTDAAGGVPEQDRALLRVARQQLQGAAQEPRRRVVAAGHHREADSEDATGKRDVEACTSVEIMSSPGSRRRRSASLPK